MISTSNELSILKNIHKFNASTEFRVFVDGGFFGENLNIDREFFLADAGLGACFNTTLMGEELTLRIDLPFITISNNSLTIDKENWVFSFQRSF